MQFHALLDSRRPSDFIRTRSSKSIAFPFNLCSRALKAVRKDDINRIGMEKILNQMAPAQQEIFDWRTQTFLEEMRFTITKTFLELVDI